MGLFKRVIQIECNKGKEETIGIIDSNIEPYHKDSSKLKFEGRITPDGEFKINLADQGSVYRKRPSSMVIKGQIIENEHEKSVIDVEFTLSKMMTIILYGAGVVYMVLAILLFMEYIQLPGSPNVWFVPPIFCVLFVLNFYLRFTTDKKKATRALRDMLR